MMLGERGAVERASEMITRDDFYRDAHGQIFDAMLHLAEKDEPVDIITLKDELVGAATWTISAASAT
jgi:replicative DNA helicase